ncbi:MAG: hypothetical protein NT062_25960 [Proteobacteria bacterium]|nr:hypothetical protein [Pseudomonadota bacterium]
MRTSPNSRDQVVELLTTVEREVRAAPAGSFTFAADGTATLTVASGRYHAGRFELPTLATLTQRAAAIDRSSGAPRDHVRLSMLRGASAANDIGSLQATAPAGTLFQVASQFNCLESPDPVIVPVHDYPFDATQGPRASVSAFPGTLLRHYQAPRADGTRFVQTDHACLDLLADVTGPGIAAVQCGYLLAERIDDPEAFAGALETRFDQLRVGVHDDLEVVLGAHWGGAVPVGAPRIAQVFGSTIALGGYSQDGDSPALARIRRQLLRAAYLGTLLGAVALGKRTVVLTLIGGGAFGNPHRDIWGAIHWAIGEVEALVHGTLDVVVNVRTDRVEASDLGRVRARGGVCVEVPTTAPADHDVWTALQLGAG